MVSVVEGLVKARSRSRVRKEFGLNLALDGPATGAGLGVLLANPGILTMKFDPCSSSASVELSFGE